MYAKYYQFEIITDIDLRKIEKKLKRLQKQVSRKYEKNKK